MHPLRHTHPVPFPPFPLPLLQKLHINPAKRDIDSFTFEDFQLIDYAPHKKIAMQMAV